MFKPSRTILTDRSMACIICESFLLFVFHIWHAVMSVPRSLVATCSERAGLLAFVCYFLVVSCHYPILYLIVSIPDIYHPYFEPVPSRE